MARASNLPILNPSYMVLCFHVRRCLPLADEENHSVIVGVLHEA